MSKHTPGPWMGWFRHAKTTTEEPSHGLVTGPPWISTKGVSGYTNPADVKLIAAAPELLAALKEMLNWQDGKGDVDYIELQTQARAAIAKAETV
jgi:hypothetical protein